MVQATWARSCNTQIEKPEVLFRWLEAAEETMIQRKVFRRSSQNFVCSHRWWGSPPSMAGAALSLFRSDKISQALATRPGPSWLTWRSARNAVDFSGSWLFLNCVLLHDHARLLKELDRSILFLELFPPSVPDSYLGLHLGDVPGTNLMLFIEARLSICPWTTGWTSPLAPRISTADRT